MNSRKKRELDFIIIGAQKAGTTSLFKYLDEHPNIYMPPEKEAPFFCINERFEKGWDWYLNEFFPGAPEGMLWGKATPHYMSDPSVPERLYRQLPKIKLIAILRDPVKRAYSHYKMCVRRGVEHRAFGEAVEAQLRLERRNLEIGSLDETECYVLWGEYGRILSSYLTFFPRGQLLITYTEHLGTDPECVVRQIFIFLGVEPLVPSNLGKRYHMGGTRQRLPWIVKLARHQLVNALWSYLPFRMRRRFAYWFHQWNTIPEGPQDSVISNHARSMLVEHYSKDVELLKKLFGLSVPWSEYQI